MPHRKTLYEKTYHLSFFLGTGIQGCLGFPDGGSCATWDFLEEEPSGVLSATLEEVGGCSVDGSTRTKVVQQREALRHQLLSLALSRHHNREARPVTVYQNLSDDKCAGSWLLAIPSPDLSLSFRVFREAFSAHLSLPSSELH